MSKYLEVKNLPTKCDDCYFQQYHDNMPICFTPDDVFKIKDLSIVDVNCPLKTLEELKK